MPTYRDWELYEVLPSGWKIDKHCGSPLFGYDFCTDGKSVINGGKRALVKSSNVNIPVPDLSLPKSNDVTYTQLNLFSKKL